MLITLKKKHIAFCMTPLRNAASITDFKLLQQLKAALADYTTPEEQVTINISATRFIQLYEYISNMPEGMSNTIAADMMENSEATETQPAFAGLQTQIMQGVLAEDPESITTLEAIITHRSGHAETLQNHINANLSFLENLEIPTI